MNKLKEVIEKVMSKSHNVFVEGRQILNVTFLANKAIDLETKRFQVGLVCQLDIETCCDHVKLKFLLLIMEKM